MGHAATSGRSDAFLKERWSLFHHDNPQIHSRDAARQLKATEAQLIATGCGETAVRLSNDWGGIAQCFPLLGRVMALTRNDHAVHERQGTYRDIHLNGDSCFASIEEVDLRFSLARWHCGFAVCETTGSGSRFSLQFFAVSGGAVHKVYLTDDSDPAAYYRLKRDYRSADQGTRQDIVSALPAPAPKPDAQVDVAGLRAHWDQLTDSQAFVVLLGQFGVTRLQALRLAGGARALQVAPSSLRVVLEAGRDLRLPLRIKVGNPGALQIYTGSIQNALPVGNWYSVLDADYNLHVRETAVESAWVVRRPHVEGSISGMVTSLELFDARGSAIARIRGGPKRGIPEDLAWRRLVRALRPVAVRNHAALKHPRR